MDFICVLNEAANQYNLETDAICVLNIAATQNYLKTDPIYELNEATNQYLCDAKKKNQYLGITLRRMQFVY